MAFLACVWPFLTLYIPDFSRKLGNNEKYLSSVFLAKLTEHLSRLINKIDSFQVEFVKD